jgi:hypothetical protein
MFFVPLTDPGAWGAYLRGSPIIASKAESDRLTVFLIPVGEESDGTRDSAHRNRAIPSAIRYFAERKRAAANDRPLLD